MSKPVDSIRLTELYKDFDNQIELLGEDIHSLKITLCEVYDAGGDIRSLASTLKPYLNDLTSLCNLKEIPNESKPNPNKKE